MEYLEWYYADGIRTYFQRWIFGLKKIVHYFALPVLLKSLFAPWKRMAIDENTGFNIQKAMEDFTFNVISRTIGFAVRIILIFSCLTALLFQGIIGIIWFGVKFAVPIFGFVDYFRLINSHDVMVMRIRKDVEKNFSQASKIIFESAPAKFVASRIGIDLAVLGDVTNNSQLQTGWDPKSYEDLVRWVIEKTPAISEKLRKMSVPVEDVYLSARYWDMLKKRDKRHNEPETMFGYPGIGMELLTGYTPFLNNYVSNFTGNKMTTNYLVGRRDVVNMIARVLDSKQCALIVGDPGVGKKSAIYEFAHRANNGELGSTLSYSRVLELNYQAILAESDDPNLKKVQLTKLFEEASMAGNVILVLKDLYRLTASEFEGIDFMDVLSKVLENGNLRIIALSDTVEYERFLARDSRIAKYFERIEVLPPTKEDAMTILLDYALSIEKSHGVEITASAIRAILEGSDRYISDIPFPEKTLELLDEVVIANQRNKIITVDSVNLVLSEKTGIPTAKLTASESNKLSNLEEIMHKDLIGQDVAVAMIAQSLRGRTLGLKNEERPVGSFLFLGPTGVGKTQTAKVLAEVYFGNKNNILRFDMAEYVGSEGVARLIGSISSNMPGALTTAIKNNPAALLLLDEIEKCPPEIFNFFLTMLDEGYITDAGGKKINCRHLFIIATSNAGSDYIRQAVTQKNGEDLQRSVVDHILTLGIFSPELLNRFDGVVVFEPLNALNMLRIAELQLQDLKNNLGRKNIELKYEVDVTQKIAREGYDPASGARPMRRIIDLTLSDLFGRALLENKIISGDRVRLIAKDARNEYTWEKC